MAEESERNPGRTTDRISGSISGFLKDLKLSERYVALMALLHCPIFSATCLASALRDNLSGRVGEMLSSTTVASEFFPPDDQSIPVASSEKVKILSLDIGNYRPEDITWAVGDEHVTVCGARCQGIQNGVQGKKFTRKIPIPDGVDPSGIKGRFSAGDGVFILEGVKCSSSKRTTTKTAYFDDLTASFTCDLGQRINPQDLGLNLSSAGSTYKELDSRNISLFGDM